MAYLEELLPEFRKGAKIRMDCWPKEEYICLREDDIVDEDGCLRCDGLDNISNWFFNSNWELYQKPIDWQYIIDNKCPVWCWDYNESKKHIEILKSIKKYETYKFSIVTPDNYVSDISFVNCRPARRDEVTFYEDRKDEL